LGRRPRILGREDDTDIGHRRLGEDAGDVVVLQRGIERREIVELDDAGGFGGIYRWPDVSAARPHRTVSMQRSEGFVHRAVVAILEHEDFIALRYFARNADGKTVGVRGGKRKLPERDAKSGA